MNKLIVFLNVALLLSILTTEAALADGEMNQRYHFSPTEQVDVNTAVANAYAQGGNGAAGDSYISSTPREMTTVVNGDVTNVCLHCRDTTSNVEIGVIRTGK